MEEKVQTTEVQLRCGVYGEASVFSVHIERNAEVEALQEAIANVLSTEQNRIAPRLLTLYLARKNGEWLKHDYSAEGLLLGDVDTSYSKMLSSWSLKKPELLGPDFAPGEEEIHVLVELPEAAVRASSEQTSLNKLIKEIHEQVTRPERKRYAHSEMSSRKGNALLQALNISVEPLEWASYVAEDQTHVKEKKAFNWESVVDEHGQEIKLTEEQQRERYRAYVEANIDNVLTEQKLCVLSVEKTNYILNVAIPGHNIEPTGCTDLLILSALVKRTPRDLQFLPGVRMLIEVMKEMKVCSEFQALSELVALDLRSTDPVLALLTDLNNDWVFFWATEDVIKTFLAQSASADADIRLPFAENPLKRRKLNQVLPSFSEGGGGGDIREAIERYYDIASVLGPDIDMARAVCIQVVRSIFSMYT